MYNLEQIRARNAMAYAQDPNSEKGGQEGGEVIKKIPPMIMNHGLLATAAYSLDPKQKGWAAAFDAITKHLVDEKIALIPAQYKDGKGLLKYLSGEADSNVLKRCTAEAMAWLNYARRFVDRKK